MARSHSTKNPQRQDLDIVADEHITVLTGVGPAVALSLTPFQRRSLLNCGCAVSATCSQVGVRTQSDHFRLCLVLTELGDKVLPTYLCIGQATNSQAEAARFGAALILLADRPLWNAAEGDLWWHGELIKQFRHDAADQRCVLNAFQRQCWVRRIADPLPAKIGRNRKVHLRETIKSLVRGQDPLRIRFRGDGTSTGLRWEDVASILLDKTPTTPPKIF
jgi:hypothetical protein